MGDARTQSESVTMQRRMDELSLELRQLSAALNGLRYSENRIQWILDPKWLALQDQPVRDAFRRHCAAARIGSARINPMGWESE